MANVNDNPKLEVMTTAVKQFSIIGKSTACNIATYKMLNITEPLK
jgi:hypothetical protein